MTGPVGPVLGNMAVMKRISTRVSVSCLLRGMAFSALTNLAMPVAEAWAADEVQVLRRAPASVTGMVPFTTFQQEELAVTQTLPCKWISKDGRLGPSYGGGRYDFLCKGGDFATVSLYLDKADSAGSAVAKARLLYRDWPVNSNPNAGEALVAQQFLAHVAGRFVPASLAGEVMDAFWGKSAKKWSYNGVNIAFVIDKGPQFNVRRLEVQGTGAKLNPQVVKMTVVVTPTDAGLAKVTDAPQVGTQVFVYGKDGEKKPLPEKTLPGVAITKGMPEQTPLDTGLTKPMPIPVKTATEIEMIAPAVVVPVPVPNVLPVPGAKPAKLGDALIVPVTTPAGGVGTAVEPEKKPEAEGTLQPATPAELNTAPAPESKAAPAAMPAEISATLVPSTKDIRAGGGGRAPSNFDAYNRAMELTKDVEAKAQIAKVEQAKVTASKPVTPTAPVAGMSYVTPSAVVVPALKPVPTPEVTVGVDRAPTDTGGAGLTTAPVVPAPVAVDQLGQPLNYNGPRSSEARPLPQLKFVPKAEPLRGGDEVIQFEDEKSRL